MVDGQSTPERSDGGGPQRSRRVLWIAVAVVAVVAIGVGVAFAVMPRGEADGPAASGSAAPSPSSSASQSAGAESPGPESAAPEATEAPVEANPFPEQEPVSPQDEGTADGIAARLVGFESVEGEVVGSGDVARPAVRVTVDITNTGSDAIDLNLVVLNAFMGVERDPAETYEQPGGSPVSGSLEPGATASGVYLFRIPEDRRDDVTFVLDYRAGQPAITFRGSVS